MTPTHRRSFRIPDDLYADAQQAAAAHGDTLTDIVRRALARYAKTRKPAPKETP